jgi:hypothetical protein
MCGWLKLREPSIVGMIGTSTVIEHLASVVGV